MYSGGTITPAEDGECYLLVFEESADETRFTVDASGAENIAFFTEHTPTEFERDSHYFQTLAGDNVTEAPGAERRVLEFCTKYYFRS